MNGQEIRGHEQASIRWWIQRAAREGCFDRGRVLDYGAGRQPYRDIVEAAGAKYVPFDRVAFPASVATSDAGRDDLLFDEGFDAILCTQVIQYHGSPLELLEHFAEALAERNGYLVLTGPTNWPENEPQDLMRWTVAGIRTALEYAGFDILALESRHELPIPGWHVSLGYGAIGWAK